MESNSVRCYGGGRLRLEDAEAEMRAPLRPRVL